MVLWSPAAAVGNFRSVLAMGSWQGFSWSACRGHLCGTYDFTSGEVHEKGTKDALAACGLYFSWPHHLCQMICLCLCTHFHHPKNFPKYACTVKYVLYVLFNISRDIMSQLLNWSANDEYTYNIRQLTS
jgi:hypothetical protein